MQRIIGPILGLLGILVVIGLVGGLAYSAGLAAAGTVVVPGGATAVAPVVGYGYYGPWLGFGFGHFLGFLLVFILFIALLRFAFGAGRRGRGHGYGYGPGWGGGWGPGYGRGPRGWGNDPAEGGADRHAADDPREAWIRSRLEEWHRAAHATGGETAGGSSSGPTPSGPTEPPAAV